MIDKEFEFTGQNEKEEVLEVIKYHGIFLIKPLLLILGLILILITLFYFFGASTISSYALMIVSLAIFYIVAINWFKWANTTYLLTNQRIICVNQESWFKRTVSEATLANILFISHKINGFLATIFNIGSIHIRTSGVVEEEIVLKNIADPYQIQQEIVEAQKKFTGKVAEIKKSPEDKQFWKAKKEKIIR